MYPSILTLISGIRVRYNLAIFVGQDSYKLSSLSHNAFRICVLGTYPKWIRIYCMDIFLRDISMTTPAVDPSFAVALVDGEVGAVRIENLERTKGLGQLLMPAAVGAEVDEVSDRQVLVLRPHAAFPVSLVASLVLVEGGAHRRDELLQALNDGALHHKSGEIGGFQR